MTSLGGVNKVVVTDAAPEAMVPEPRASVPLVAVMGPLPRVTPPLVMVMVPVGPLGTEAVIVTD